MSSILFHKRMRFSLAAILLITCNFAVGQDVQLSPTQQQMLNSLPPSQREQALDALRQLNSQQQGGAQQTINEPLSNVAAEADLTTIERDQWTAGPTANPRSRVAINFSSRSSLTRSQTETLRNDPALQNLLGTRLFVLDDSGVLQLPGLEAIPLLGLSEPEINRRIMAEPYLSLLNADAHILGQKPIGLESLKPFGYDIFAPRATDMGGSGSGPVPPDYVLGPGDSIRVQLFGNVNEIYEYEVSRDGVLNLPDIGPVNVAGASFSEFRSDLNKRVQQMLIGTQVSVTMGQLRTIRVFVLGDVNRPGSYVVGGLSTISGALYQSGGISQIGSLRNIQLKRNGKVVGVLDAYDLLIHGDTSGDRRLQPGDAIFVPPIGKTISVDGAVNRPAIYEVKRLTTVADLVGLAGGLTPEAFAGGARLERIGDDGERIALAIDLDGERANTVVVRKGDALIVPKVLPELGNAVELAGHVFRPGVYPWRDGMRLSDLIPSTNELKPGVDMDYLLIRREGKRGDPVEALSASLSVALQNRGSESDVPLRAGDIVNVFGRELGRQRVVQSILNEMRLQSTADRPAQQVQVSGSVRVPGIYPLEANMRVSDLIRAGGDLSENAYALEAELTRYSVSPIDGRVSDTRQVDLAAIRNGDSSADIVLQEHDYLIVKRVPDWDSIWTITIEGEVQFPGEYRVQPGETLAEVLQRAGGLTRTAFPEGAVFLRESLKAQEQEQRAQLARRMEADLASLSLESGSAGGAETLSNGRILLQQLQNTEAMGRLVIDLQAQASDESLEVRDGDRLLIPTKPQVVTVLGETQQNTSHLYRQEFSRDDYLALSGGLTRRADRKLIYIVRANGSVVSRPRSRWFGRGKNTEIRPGDTIVVPLDTDRMRPLTFWGNVTQILYQGAIAVAAVKTFE